VLRLIFHFTFFISLLLCASANVQAKVTYDITRIQNAPVIDGKISKDEWQKATKVELAFNINPGDSVPAPVKTFAYMMEDGENLYVAFDAHDPEPEKILAYIRDRDSIFQDDFVGIIVDTFNDERRGFEFFVNPMGSQGDLTRDDTLHNEDSSWDTVWDSAGQVGSNGYTVEMSIPFRALRFAPDLAEQTWGIQFIRIYPRDSRMTLTDSPNDRKLDCTLCQINKVKGMPELQSSGANFDITPTVTYVQSEERDVEANEPWNTVSDDFEFGGDFRWAMTEDWILNATVNPDFSQVEADVGQLDVNTTFSLFFPESRPFFLDGADYFKSRNRLVHTRNIANPDYGIKVTGKTNGYTGGVIAASDTETSFLLPGSLGSDLVTLENQSSDILIARGQMDMGKKNNLGLLVTHRSGNSYSNQVASIDGKYYFTEKDVFDYQVMHSSSENPMAIQFDLESANCQDDSDPNYDPNNDPDCERELAAEQSDHAVSLRYVHNEEDYSFRVNYSDFGEDFRADLGFIGRVDYKQIVIGGDYVWRGEKESKWTRWGFFGDWDRTEDQSGLLLEEESELHMFINGPLQFRTNFGFVDRKRFFEDVYFDEDQFMMWFEFKPLSSLTLGNFMRLGDQVDFTHAQLGEVTLFEPYVKWQVGKHFNVNLTYTSQKLDVPGGELFEANLMDLRLAYQFNNRSRLSLTLQSTDINRNLALYEDNQDADPENDFLARSKDFGTQLIYSYKINPQSLFYLGYSDNAFKDDNVTSLTKTDKTVFAKFSYLWQH